MNRLQVNFPFFLWFPTFASKMGMQNVSSIPSINVQTNFQKIWHFSNGSTLSSVHPPADVMYMSTQMTKLGYLL